MRVVGITTLVFLAACNFSLLVAALQRLVKLSGERDQIVKVLAGHDAVLAERSKALEENTRAKQTLDTHLQEALDRTGHVCELVETLGDILVESPDPPHKPHAGKVVTITTRDREVWRNKLAELKSAQA